MPPRSYFRGHEIVYNGVRWVYADDQSPADHDHERPCVLCGEMPTPEGHDACLGYVEGASSACCGHGVTDSYVIKKEIPV